MRVKKGAGIPGRKKRSENVNKRLAKPDGKTKSPAADKSRTNLKAAKKKLIKSEGVPKSTKAKKVEKQDPDKDPNKPEDVTETPSNKDASGEVEDSVKPPNEKSKAISKILKNLDIQISGFDSNLPPEEKIIVDLKSSISENVKTKCRAAATKVVATASGSKQSKKDENKAKDIKSEHKEASEIVEASSSNEKVKDLPVEEKSEIEGTDDKLLEKLKKKPGRKKKEVGVNTPQTVKPRKILKEKEKKTKKSLIKSAKKPPLKKEVVPAKQFTSAPRSKSLEKKKTEVLEVKDNEPVMKATEEEEKVIAQTEPEKVKEKCNEDEKPVTAADEAKSEEHQEPSTTTKKATLTVRQRLQKKYKITTTHAKVSKQTKLPKTVSKKATMPPKKEEETMSKDVYDFKSGSESEDNIKMVLPTLKKLKEFSDEDDKPLQVHKDKLKSDNEKKPETPVKVPKKKPATPVKVQKKKVTVKIKVVASEESGSSSDSDEEIYVGPKRQRMASLNALAKVQCLYDNESRTAHELGLSKTVQMPKMRTLNSSSGSEDEKEAEKVKETVMKKKEEIAEKTKETVKKKEEVKEEPKEEPKADDVVEGEEEEEVEEVETKRELRNTPGMRGAGKLWEFHGNSSFEESANESDAEEKKKLKKRKLQKLKAVAKREKEKLKKTEKPVKKKKVKIQLEEGGRNSDSSEPEAEQKREKIATAKKRKKVKEEIVNDCKGILARKRMASLNASAIVAATYEVERHLDRNLASDCSSFDSFAEDEKLAAGKKANKDLKSDPSDETKDSKDSKEATSRPTSSSVVIVQDTDVTITGVYVNPATGSSQEAYCKMQYRVQSSVTEERVMRPSSSDPPKSYTPLSALSSMRPPGAAAAAAAAAGAATATCEAPPSVEPVLHHPNPYPHPANINPDPPPPYHYPPHPPPHHVASTIPSSGGPPPHHPHPPPDHSAPIHHYSHPAVAHHYLQPAPIQPTPMAQGSCESSMHYQPGGYQSQSAMPLSSGGSSAFCAPSMQQSHHDISGYYQPAGPLISQHILPPVSAPNSNVPLVPASNTGSKKQIPTPLDSDPEQLQQPPQSTSTAESSDSDVLITGGDLSTFRYPPASSSSQHPQTAAHLHQQQQQQAAAAAAQNSAYSRSMHQMHYPPTYPSNYYTPYPGEAMCYSPTYQPYFPAKVYQSSPAYRRFPSYYPPGPGQPPPPVASDLYDTSQPGSAPPPPTGSQLVPAGPTQHLEHYPAPPGYYSGYSPGGQCYSRGMQPAYMEYPPPCPCPMQQSCPKNALTGPLIGSNSSSVNSSNNISSITTTNLNSNNNNNNTTTISSSSNNNTSHNPIILPTMNITNSTLNTSALKSNSSTITNSSSSSSISTSSSLNNNTNSYQQLNTVRGPVKNVNSEGGDVCHIMHMPCKVEPIEPMKSELKMEETDIKSTQYEENVVPPTPPPISYTINDKLLEPEMTLSPARGSTGLPTLPEPEPTEQQAVNGQLMSESAASEISLTNVTVIGRKARIGKSMAREMMYGSMLHHHHHPLSGGQMPAAADLYPNPVSFAALTSQRTNSNLIEIKDSSQTSPLRLKQPEIKMENIKAEKEEEEDEIVVILDDDKDVKKIKTEEPEVVEINDSASIEAQEGGEGEICGPTPSKRMKILEFGKGQSKKTSPTNGYKSLIKQTEPKSYLCLSRKADKKDRFGNISKAKNTFRKRKLVLTDQQKKRLKQHKRKLIAMAKTQTETEAKEEAERVESEKKKKNDERLLPLPLPTTTESSQQSSSLDTTIDLVARGYFSEPEIRSFSATSSTGRKARKTKATASRSKSETKKATSTESIEMEPELEPLGLKKKGRKPKATKPQETKEIENLPTESQTGLVEETTLIEPTLTNNNNFLETNNNEKTISSSSAETEHIQHMDIETPSDDVLFRQPAPPSMSRSYPGKRARSRVRFGSRKKHRNRYSMANEVDEAIIIPTKPNVAPKWSNGWAWEGEPFQGKVFLNSDEPLVIRKCYPAMRHSEGDTIRSRDCILLRAGTKKNELPYVAKVAHLWENPEDGEMMVSLLWYYRPEHTEQGRQPADAPDEVFASKHRDHNSVACIEDKCYVLTFNEYCRYRRNIRASEEGIEDQFSIVPKLPNLETRRQVPLNTNPELVLFCQRIYEFRLKRLMKMPNT